MSNYTPSALKDLVHAEIETRIKLRELITEVLRVQQFVKDQTASSYFQYGVTRRLYVLARTFDRIFELYPPDRSVPLLYDDRIDLEINLHAFMIHVHGVVDNLALVIGHELNMVGDGNHRLFLLSPDDQQQPMYLHPQVIADIATVDEITRVVINCIRPEPPDE